MARDKESPKPDRYHLMTAFRDASILVTKGMPEEVEGISIEDRLDAISALNQARNIMEKHEMMESYSVFPFFDHLALNEEQTGTVMRTLVEHRITTCHKLLEVPVDIMEVIIGEKGVLPGIPYPLALRALHIAYHKFHYKGPSPV